MDMYFESGGDVLLSLDEMLGGGELDPLGSSGVSCSGGESPWDDWTGPPLALDLSGDPPPGIMVNPNTVIPSSKTAMLQLKKEMKSEAFDDDEDDDEEEDDEEEEEEEEEEEDDEEEEEKGTVVQVKMEEEENNSRDLWTTLVMKPVKSKPHDIHVGKPRASGYLKRSPSQSQSQSHGGIKILNQARSGGRFARSPPLARSLIVSPAFHASKPKKEAENGFASDQEYPKPAYSYSCLIAMALKNSTTGSLPVSEIYNFMCEHFPYFKSAPAGWKNSVRHNLSLNKCFEKIEKGGSCGSSGGGRAQRKGCLWAMNPSKVAKMDDEVAKWSKKDPQAIRRAMKYPETLERLERGDMKIGSTVKSEEEEEEEESEADEASSSRSISDDDQGSEDEGEVPPSLKPFDSRLNSSLIVSADANLANDLEVEFSEEMYEELGLLQQVLSNGDEDLADIFSTPSKRPRLECVASPIQRHAIASHQ